MALSEDKGLGIARQTELKTFKPFFIDFTLPYHVIRGEQTKIPLTVYNYLAVCAEVTAQPSLWAVTRAAQWAETHSREGARLTERSAQQRCSEQINIAFLSSNKHHFILFETRVVGWSVAALQKSKCLKIREGNLESCAEPQRRISFITRKLPKIVYFGGFFFPQEIPSPLMFSSHTPHLPNSSSISQKYLQNCWAEGIALSQIHG